MGTHSKEERKEARTPSDKAGRYFTRIEQECFEEGGTTVLNISSEGMLLDLPKAYYDVASIIELTLPDARHGQFTTMLEPRWSQSRHQPDRYLVGCRTLFACFS